MCELKYFVACTVDKFIARKDHSYDFLWKENKSLIYMKIFLKQFQLEAREKLGLKDGISNPCPQMRQYVFSHTLKESPDNNVELVSYNAVELIIEGQYGTIKF